MNQKHKKNQKNTKTNKTKYKNNVKSDCLSLILLIYIIFNLAPTSYLKVSKNICLSPVEIYQVCQIILQTNKKKMFPMMTRKQWNKMMHYKNGNKRMMKQKKHLKVLQLNKGSSNIDKHKIVNKNSIMRSQADIIVLSEAQV